MGDLVAVVELSAVLPRVREGIQCLTHGPIANRVDVDGKSGSVGRADDAIQFVRRVIGRAAITARMAMAVEVGFKQRGRLRRIFYYAIGEDLDGVGTEKLRIDGPLRAKADRLVDLG